MLSRLLYGARTAMMVALFASLGAMIIGSILAHIAGYFGGVVDWIIGRLVDVWMSFPPVILSLILMVGLGVGLDGSSSPSCWSTGRASAACCAAKCWS